MSDERNFLPSVVDGLLAGFAIDNAAGRIKGEEKTIPLDDPNRVIARVHAILGDVDVSQVGKFKNGDWDITVDTNHPGGLDTSSGKAVWGTYVRASRGYSRRDPDASMFIPAGEVIPAGERRTVAEYSLGAMTEQYKEVNAFATRYSDGTTEGSLYVSAPYFVLPEQIQHARELLGIEVPAFQDNPTALQLEISEADAKLIGSLPFRHIRFEPDQDSEEPLTNDARFYLKDFVVETSYKDSYDIDYLAFPFQTITELVTKARQSSSLGADMEVVGEHHVHSVEWDYFSTDHKGGPEKSTPVKIKLHLLLAGESPQMSVTSEPIKPS